MWLSAISRKNNPTVIRSRASFLICFAHFLGWFKAPTYFGEDITDIFLLATAQHCSNFKKFRVIKILCSMNKWKQKRSKMIYSMNTLKHTLAKCKIFQLNQTVWTCLQVSFGNVSFFETAKKIKPPLRNLQQKPHFHYKLVKVPLYLNKKACIGGTDGFSFINNIWAAELLLQGCILWPAHWHPLQVNKK